MKIVSDTWTASATAARNTINFIPPEERDATGLLVVGAAALAASFTFPRSKLTKWISSLSQMRGLNFSGPWARRLLAFPLGISSAVYACYPITSNKIASVGVHTIENLDLLSVSFVPLPPVSKAPPSSSSPSSTLPSGK